MLLLVILPPMSVCCWCNPAARAGSLCTALAAILRTRDYMGGRQQLLEAMLMMRVTCLHLH